jgi:uncharacterized protein YjeT (DUF2065 family)
MASGGIVRDGPRIALGVIRLTNGLVALLVPRFLAERLGRAGEPSSASHYLLRMFGIRTVFLGLDLLLRGEERRREALRRAPIIHGSDVLAALVAGASRQLPFRAAAAGFGISCVNLWLAFAARADEVRRRPRSD